MAKNELQSGPRGVFIRSSQFAIRYSAPLFLLLLSLAAVEMAVGQTATAPATQPAGEPAVAATPAEQYGAWVLLPPAAAIVLAIAFRSVIPALTIGILVGAYMLAWALPPAEVFGGGVLAGVRVAVETHLVAAVAEPDHIKILVFSMTIGGMVGVIAANGGTRAVVERVARWASTPRRGQVTTWFGGLLVFFDDYANAMIVGPAMRPICDRLRISRAKLAYIVDSTAAPVASIALIGTWVGAEISFIQQGLVQANEAGAPAFLGGVTAYPAFIQSIPHRFYAILALAMVLIIALLGRDFGPMLRAERDAQAPPEPDDEAYVPDVSEAPQSEGRAWYAVAPVLVMIGMTVGLLGATGWSEHRASPSEPTPGLAPWLDTLQSVISKSDPYNSILYGSLSGMLVALMISLLWARMSVTKTVDAATDVMSRMFPTFVVLVLAWTLAGVMEGLELGKVAVALLHEYQFHPRWLPTLVFAAACIVSFATGTSWGTMGILCPATVTIAAGLFGELPQEQALELFYASVGAVLAGAIFGDHCSPISDTTVLSSLATQCSLEQHVWTQMPYALVVAIVAILAGNVVCQEWNQPAWVGLLAGVGTLLVIVLVFGRRARTAPAAP